MNNVKFKKIISIGLVAATIFIAVPQRAFAASTDTASASKADSKSYKVSAGISAADAYDSAIKAKNIAEAYTDYASSDVVSNFNKAFQQLDQAYYYAGIAYTSERFDDASNASANAYNSSIGANAAYNAAANTKSQFADYVFVKAAYAANAAAAAAYHAADAAANATYASYAAAYAAEDSTYAASYAAYAAYAAHVAATDSTNASYDATYAANAVADTKTAASTADSAISDSIAKVNADAKAAADSNAADAAKIKSDATNVTNATDKTATLVAPALGDSSKSGTITIAIPVPGKTPAPLTSAQLSTQLGTIAQKAPKTTSKTNVLSSASQQDASQNVLTLFK